MVYHFGYSKNTVLRNVHTLLHPPCPTTCTVLMKKITVCLVKGLYSLGRGVKNRPCVRIKYLFFAKFELIGNSPYQLNDLLFVLSHPTIAFNVKAPYNVSQCVNTANYINAVKRLFNIKSFCAEYLLGKKEMFIGSIPSSAVFPKIFLLGPTF